MSQDEELQRVWRGVVEKLPSAIRIGIMNTKASPTGRLRYVDMAIRLFDGPVGGPETDLDIKNAREAGIMLRDAIPDLEKIRDGHRSERLRRRLTPI